jgi:hypothetical protein
MSALEKNVTAAPELAVPFQDAAGEPRSTEQTPNRRRKLIALSGKEAGVNWLRQALKNIGEIANAVLSILFRFKQSMAESP